MERRRKAIAEWSTPVDKTPRPLPVGRSNLPVHRIGSLSTVPFLIVGMVSLVILRFSFARDSATSLTFDSNMQVFPDTSSTLLQLGTQNDAAADDDPCLGYQGILLISQGDQEGAAGTIFFLFVLNQLLYAEKFGLIPWIHLSNVSHYVYDERVHGGVEQHYELYHGLQASWRGFRDSVSGATLQFPGKPTVKDTLVKRNVTLTGNGVWASYFQPVSRLDPLHPSCIKLPLVRLLPAQILPGLHIHAPWALRAWRYGGLPPTLAQPDVPYEKWFAPMRERGSALVTKYLRPQPWLLRQVEEVNSASGCLAVHIRHSDKANRRQKIPVSRFLPYLSAYARQATAPTIYLATDSEKVVSKVASALQQDQHKIDLLWQKNILRSNDTTAVFRMSSPIRGHHETNSEVLVDILAMSKCQWIIHGFSAVSEAVHYLNPNLANRSINLDYPSNERVSMDTFQSWLRDSPPTLNIAESNSTDKLPRGVAS